MKKVLLAPNGKPSKLTTTQYELVRTPAFKKWFGDWENDPANASKVVDENGEPLVVYHGTNSHFTKFDLEKVGSNVDYGMWGSGFYFSPLRSFSKYYGSKILKLFLNIRNPFVRNPNIQGSNAQFKSVYGKEASLNLRNEILSSNYDGVFQYESGQKNLLTQIVAFEPNQVKLADGTNITFDSGSDDIRFAKGGKAKGDCYLVAGEIAMGINNKKIEYKGTPYLVHAEVKHSTLDGVRFGHAFIEDDVNVYDFSNNREIIIPKELYYYFGDIDPKNKKKYRKYTFKEARKKMVSTGNYGCWDLDVKYGKGGEVESKNTLKAKKIADEFESKISNLECDGATRVLHYLFQEQNVNHVVKKGAVIFGKNTIPLHFWIELPDGYVVDYKSRMWLGEKAQQGVFKPSSKTEYLGEETDLKVSKFIYEILTMNKGGFIEKPIPEYLKMFLGF